MDRVSVLRSNERRSIVKVKGVVYPETEEKKKSGEEVIVNSDE